MSVCSVLIPLAPPAVVDSASKLVTGVLYGNMADLGNFDECVTSSPSDPDNPADPDSFTGRYALPTIHIQKQTNSSETGLLSQLQRRLPLTRPRRHLGNDQDQVSQRQTACRLTEGLA